MRVVGWAAAALACVTVSACGESGTWTCTNDNTLGLGTTRLESTSGKLVGCKGEWKCETHDYKVDCVRQGSDAGWTCNCTKNGVTNTSFTNTDICDIAADDSKKPQDRDVSIRNRINDGCLWKLPIDH